SYQDCNITSFMIHGEGTSKMNLFEPHQHAGIGHCFDARMNALTLRHDHTVPAILANAGENAATKFLEFFAARIRNLNTREAYARACAQFLAWSEQHLDDIRLITPMHVAAYIEQHPGSPQTIKQHLAAIKMLFDYLVVSQIVPVNPAA